MHAQYNNGTEIWSEEQVYQYIVKLVTEKQGVVNDTCSPLFSKGTKDIYILKRPYLQKLPDTINGYTIHQIHVDSNRKWWRKQQKEKGLQVFYISDTYHDREYYQYWIFPVTITKKEIEYAKMGYRFHFLYHLENNKFEFTKAGCLSW